MAEGEPGLDSSRFEELLGLLARMAAGEVELRLPVTANHDALDAIAHGVNILAQEVSYCSGLLREEKEAALRASRAKSALVAEISHDIRTPLMAISSFADLLSREDLPPERRADYLRRVKANCASLNALIDDVLDLSRAESGGTQLNPVEISIRQKVEEALVALEPLAKQKGLGLEAILDPQLPEILEVDPLRFWQILNNLVGNAIKFSHEGVIKVRVGFLNGNTLCLEVMDRGIGVAEEAQSRIFKHFAQADSSIGRRFGGTGLGLALSRDLCRAMGGDLTLVRSEPGQGSHFRATLFVETGGRGESVPAAATSFLS